MADATKTTLTDLLAGGNAQVQSLIAGSIDEPIDFGDEPITLTPPRVGDYWHGQGGYYAGIIRDGDRQWHLILADQQHGLMNSEWGIHGETVPGQFSRRDGQHNTALILSADPENKIASHLTALLIEGHKDFYWPAGCENILLFCNLQEHLARDWHWSSTQHSAFSAWGQCFDDGLQDFANKSNSFAARAVRRVIIQ